MFKFPFTTIENEEYNEDKVDEHSILPEGGRMSLTSKFIMQLKEQEVVSI